MSDLLFDIPEAKSPRLLWMEKNGFLTHYYEGFSDEFGDATEPWMAIIPFDSDKGKCIGTIMAESCRFYEDRGAIGYGQTEAEAIENCARLKGIHLWNEGGQP